MSKAKLKRTLFIGLGGTGAAALLHTKKRFLDTYGEIPPMIDFLVIDTDRNIENRFLERDNILEIHKETNQKLSFQKSEFIHTKVIGARQVYERNSGTTYNWMPTNNAHVLKNIATGAGQVRSNGRFSVFYNQETIASSITNKVDSIRNIIIGNSNRFSLKGNDVEVNIVFSVAGGTGSGSFLDVAYLIKRALSEVEEVKITGYVVLPDVFNAMMTGISMANTKPNGFGALKELDFFMKKNIGSNMDLSINFPQNPIEIDANPFDIIFTINNTNREGQTINHINSISEQIALALFTGAGELSGNVDSVYDNVENSLLGGSLDIEGKKAWACGMGASELFYDGNTLGNIYANRVIITMVDSLLNTDEDSPSLADNFIDSGDVKIRENGGNQNNYLMDSLLNVHPNAHFNIQDGKAAQNELSSFLINIEENARKEISEKYDYKINEVLKLLDAEVKNIINKDCGVGNSATFLKDLKNLISIFNEEMKEENKKLNQESEHLKNAINEEIEELKGLQSGTMSFLNKNRIKATKDSIEDSVNREAVIAHELLRREFAQMFFNKLNQVVNDYITNTQSVIQKLERVKERVNSQANRLSNAANDRQKIFVIDLHKAELNNIRVNKKIFNIREFVATLNPHNNIYSLYQSTEDTIREYFFRYAKELPEAKSFVNKSIDDVLRGKSTEELEDIAKKLIDRSQALWQTNYHGFMAPQIQRQFVVGIERLDLQFKNSFENLLQPGDNIEFVATRVKNKITCFRMESAVPLFAVSGVSEYENIYQLKNKKKEHISYHIDQLWQRKMQEEDFSIWPQRKADNSLPLWVLGLSYGFIRLNENNKYEIFSLEQADALNDYWKELGQYRDLAFNAFKHGGYLDELENNINKKKTEEGRARTNKFIADIKNNYKEKYMQLNVDWNDLKTPPYKAVADLVRSELNFINNELEE